MNAGRSPAPQRSASGSIQFHTTRALPHLAIPELHADCAASVLPAAPHATLDPLAAAGFVLLLWVVEPLLPVPGVYSTALDYLLVALMDHCPRVDRGVGRDA